MSIMEIIGKIFGNLWLLFLAIYAIVIFLGRISSYITDLFSSRRSKTDEFVTGEDAEDSNEENNLPGKFKKFCSKLALFSFNFATFLLCVLAAFRVWFPGVLPEVLENIFFFCFLGGAGLYAIILCVYNF